MAAVVAGTRTSSAPGSPCTPKVLAPAATVSTLGDLPPAQFEGVLVVDDGAQHGDLPEINGLDDVPVCSGGLATAIGAAAG
jgi:hypothetical protein